MESPFKDIDYERDNAISNDYYNRGYADGFHAGSIQLSAFLCSLPKEKLIEWYIQNKATQQEQK